MYTNIFGGSTVQPSEVSYTSFTIVANLVLTWPSQFIDSLDVAAHIIDIDATIGGLSVSIGNATFVSPGQDVLFNNVGANAFTVRDFNNGALVVINPGTSWYIYLIDNTTPQGTWRTVPFAGGAGPGVTFVGAVSNTANITIAGSPIVNAGTFTFGLGASLAAIAAIGAGGPNGYLVQTGPDTWATRIFVPGLNINIINVAGLAGNTQIALNPNIFINQATIGNIMIAANTISTTDANGNLNLSPNGVGNIVLDNVTQLSSGSALQFFNAADTFYIGLVAGAGVAANTTFTLPLTDGTAGQAIVTNGAAALSFANVSGFPSGPGTSTINNVARFADVNGNIKNSIVTISDAGVINCFGATISNLVIGQGGLGNQISSPGQNIVLIPGPNSQVNINQNVAPGASQLALNNATATQYVGFRVAPALAATTNYQIPPDGNNNQVWSTNGAGVISWRNTQEIKAWADVTGNTGIATSSFGCTVLRTAAGLYTITLTTPFATDNYSIVAQVNGTDDATASRFDINYYGQLSNQFQLKVINNAGAIGDPVNFSFMVIG